jgi:hypothetical protein
MVQRSDQRRQDHTKQRIAQGSQADDEVVSANLEARKKERGRETVRKK